MEPILSERSVLSLLKWYSDCKRDLPWRHTSDPYRIWLSEIMLQQTRVEAVKPYYEKFLSICPTVDRLAMLPEDDLMKLWEGLGYYSRARNLQKSAKTVMEKFGGKMPASYEELLSLPGIGEYTAGAIASIAFGIRVPAVDGNVLRVLARVSGMDADIALPETKAEFRKALFPLLPHDVGSFNQALIELGATVCVPNGEARCDCCPLATVCRAYLEHRIGELPVKSAKKPRKVQPLTVLVIRDDTRTVLHKRPPRGLLAGLFELPNLEGHLSADEVREAVRNYGLEPLQIRSLGPAKHIFTHIEWQMIGFSVRVSPEFDGFPDAEKGMLFVENLDLHAHFAIPSAFSAYITDL